MQFSGAQFSTRDQLIDHTITTWNAFVQYLNPLPEAAWVSHTDAAGWTVKDHVSHVTQWDIALVRLFAEGTPLQVTLQIPDSEWQVDYVAINERIRQRNLADSVATVKADRDAVWLQVLSTLQQLNDKQLAAPAGAQGINVDEGDQSPLLQVLIDYQGGHYAAHLEYIQHLIEEGPGL